MAGGSIDEFVTLGIIAGWAIALGTARTDANSDAGVLSGGFCASKAVSSFADQPTAAEHTLSWAVGCECSVEGAFCSRLLRRSASMSLPVSGDGLTGAPGLDNAECDIQVGNMQQRTVKMCLQSETGDQKR